MKTALIFAYKGNVGATTDIENGKFINDVNGSGQLGCVIHTSEVSITKEAKEIIKSARREGGSFAELMLTKHADGSGSSIGLFGFGKHHFGTDFTIGRTCDISVLDDCEEAKIEIPEDYKKFIDSNS